MAGSVDTADHAISINDLKFGYGSGEDVLAIQELQVVQSRRVFLFGPSGCGKSTLLSMIGGVLTPREGSVSILGAELSDMKGADRDCFRADRIGFIFSNSTWCRICRL